MDQRLQRIVTRPSRIGSARCSPAPLRRWCARSAREAQGEPRPEPLVAVQRGGEGDAREGARASSPSSPAGIAAASSTSSSRPAPPALAPPGLLGQRIGGHEAHRAAVGDKGMALPLAVGAECRQAFEEALHRRRTRRGDQHLALPRGQPAGAGDTQGRALAASAVGGNHQRTTATQAARAGHRLGLVGGQAVAVGHRHPATRLADGEPGQAWHFPGAPANQPRRRLPTAAPTEPGSGCESASGRQGALGQPHIVGIRAGAPVIRGHQHQQAAGAQGAGQGRHGVGVEASPPRRRRSPAGRARPQASARPGRRASHRAVSIPWGPRAPSTGAHARHRSRARQRPHDTHSGAPLQPRQPPPTTPAEPPGMGQQGPRSGVPSPPSLWPLPLASGSSPLPWHRGRF